MEGQRQHLGTAGKPGEQRVGRWTGRAALGREQLDHDRAFARLYRRDAEREAKGKQESACFDHAAILRPSVVFFVQQSVSEVRSKPDRK